MMHFGPTEVSIQISRAVLHREHYSSLCWRLPTHEPLFPWVRTQMRNQPKLIRSTLGHSRYSICTSKERARSKSTPNLKSPKELESMPSDWEGLQVCKRKTVPCHQEARFYYFQTPNSQQFRHPKLRYEMKSHLFFSGINSHKSRRELIDPTGQRS